VKLCIIVLAAANLAILGCSTPQVALDHANHGVVLTQGLQTELERFRRNSELAAQRRLNAIEEIENQAGGIARTNAFANYLRSKSGMNDELAAQELLRDASNTYAKLGDDDEAARRELRARLAALVKELPSPSDKLDATQKALAELGSELSASERLKIVAGFLRDAKAIVDKNAQQADRAAAGSGASE
jgi:hypothetical protein